MGTLCQMKGGQTHTVTASCTILRIIQIMGTENATLVSESWGKKGWQWYVGRTESKRTRALCGRHWGWLSSDVNDCRAAELAKMVHFMLCVYYIMYILCIFVTCILTQRRDLCYNHNITSPMLQIWLSALQQPCLEVGTLPIL